jgi:hypothetical protein
MGTDVPNEELFGGASEHDNMFYATHEVMRDGAKKTKKEGSPSGYMYGYEMYK